MEKHKSISEHMTSAFQMCHEERGDWKGNEVRRPWRLSSFLYKKKWTLKN